jgi:hypothetical protein
MAAAGGEETTQRRLRVALLLGAPTVGAWAARAIELVRSEPGVEVVLAVLDPDAAADDGRPRASGALALYRRADDLLFGADDALALRDARPRLGGVATLHARARSEGDADAWPTEVVDRVRAERVDVALALSLRPQRAASAAMARLGLFACHVGADATGGVSEVFARAAGTETGLRKWLPGRAVPESWIRAVAPTDPVSPRRGVGAALAHTAEQPLLALRDLLRGRTEPRLAPRVAGSGPRASGSGAIALGAARVAGRIAARRLVRALFHETWQIGARRGGDPLDATGVRYFESPRDRFFADPFAIERDGRTFLFFEQLRYARGLGEIAWAELLPDGRLGAPEIALERPWHLSYPFLFEHEEALYLLPESGSVRRVELYRCVEFPGRFEPCATLLDGVAAFDPTLHRAGDRLWLFAAVAPAGGNSYAELHAFHARELTGPWTPHPENPLVSDARSGRPAGAIFRRGDAWVRPAQDCAREYGAAIRFQRIVRLDQTGYAEEECAALLPTKRRQVGIHTVNRAGAVTAFDRRILRPRLGALLRRGR